MIQHHLCILNKLNFLGKLIENNLRDIIYTELVVMCVLVGWFRGTKIMKKVSINICFPFAFVFEFFSNKFIIFEIDEILGLDLVYALSLYQKPRLYIVYFPNGSYLRFAMINISKSFRFIHKNSLKRHK